MGSFGPIFLVPFPYRNGGENWCFETFLSKSVINAENGVVLTPIFSTIPL